MPTLQELLLGAANDPQARYGGGMGSSQPSPSGSFGLDPAIEAQIAALSQPEPVTDQPVPGKSKLWQRLASALADAGSAYAAGMGAGRNTDFTGRLLGKDRAADEIAAGNVAAHATSERNAKTKGAELRLQAILREQARAERQLANTADAAEKEAALKQRQQEKAYAEAIRREEDAAKTAAVNKQMEFQQRMATAGQRHDENLVKLKDSLEGDKSKKAAVDLKALGEGKAGVNQIANNLPKLLETVQPQQIRTMFRRSMSELNLGPEAEQALQAYFDQEVESQMAGQVLPGQGP